MSKFILAVQHYNKNARTQIYWFELKAELAEQLTIGDWVLCDTMYGPQTGTVVYKPLLIVRDQDFCTLQNVLGFHSLRPVISKINYETEDMPF